MSFPESTRYVATIANEPLSNSAWFCLNPEELLQPAPQRIGNVTLSGVDGALGRPRFNDSQTVDLRFEMVGDVDPDGDPYSDPEAGLATNKRLFLAAFLRATADSFGCVEASIEDRDGTEYAGSVQVDRPIWGDGLTDCSFTMSVTIMYGELVAVGS